MKPILAGGAVVTRQHPVRGTEVVVIHRKRYDDWTLPKGKAEAGEAVPVAAVREVWEETGARIRLGVPLDTIRYDSGQKGLKQVDYWGGILLDLVRRAPDAEVDVVSWLPVRAALARLTYAHDHFLLEQFLEQPETSPLILLRHAKAMDRKDWSRKDAARPLNSRGRRQTRLLVPMLSAYGVTRLVSSTSTRCVSTLLPYAARHNLRIKEFPQLTEEQGAHEPKTAAKVVAKVRRSALAAREVLVICVHRPVLPHILEALQLAPANLATGEFLVAHLTPKGEVHAVERHRPQA